MNILTRLNPQVTPYNKRPAFTVGSLLVNVFNGTKAVLVTYWLWIVKKQSFCRNTSKSRRPGNVQREVNVNVTFTREMGRFAILKAGGNQWN
jgi:hypothetical protein